LALSLVAFLAILGPFHPMISSRKLPGIFGISH
jgi:hypothetical protein